MKPGQARLVLLVIAFVAAFLRFWQIDVLPPGLHHDEAFEGVMALEVMRGTQRPVFFAGNFGVEPANIYLNALAFTLFGPSAPLMRIVGASVGLLTVLLTYAVARELFHDEGEGRARTLGLLAAAGLAVLYWHVNFSRQGIEPILVPLVLALFSLFLWRGLRTGRPADFLWSGAAFGFLPYTYTITRIFPLLPVLFLGPRLLFERSFWSRYRTGLAIFLLMAMLVVAPLAHFALENPELFLLRSTQVYAAESEPAPVTLAKNSLKVAISLVGEGDRDQRNNLPGRPALDLLMAIPFAVGLVGSLRRWRQPRHAYLLLWLAVGLLPTVLTDYPPHFRRAIAATVPLVILVAWGWTRILEIRHRIPVHSLLIAGTLLISGLLTCRDYFQVWGRDPGLFYAYDVGLTQIAARINQLDDPAATVWQGKTAAAWLASLPADAPVYLSPTAADHPTLTFFRATRRPVQSYDGRQVLVLPPPNQPAVYVTITREDQRSATQYQNLGGTFLPITELRDRFNRPYATFWLRLPGADAPRPSSPVLARLGEVVQFLGYDLTGTDDRPVTGFRPGQETQLTLYWQALAPMAKDYTVFVQLLGPTNPASGGPVWAQDDSQPGRNSYPTSRWRAGETILDRHHLTFPAQPAAGSYELIVGLYLLATQERLPVYDASGTPLPDRRISLQEWTIP